MRRSAPILANTTNGQGYDMVFMGQVAPFKVNIDEVEERLNQPNYALVAQSLRDIGIGSAIDLFATYAAKCSDLGQHHQRAGLRHGLHGAGSAVQSQYRRGRRAPEPAELRPGGAIPARHRDRFRYRSLCHLCGEVLRSWPTPPTGRATTWSSWGR